MISQISAIVLTKNEEKNIGLCLDHLKDFSDVIVVDSGSQDRTVEIALSRGARVVQFTWDKSYPKKKQWALENAGSKNRWVLLLDADEYPSDALIKELDSLDLNQRNNIGAYGISLRYRFAGKLLRWGHKVRKVSLLLKSDVHFPEVGDLNAPGISEVEGHYQPQTKLKVGRLKQELIHDDRDPISSWFERHNKYSDWEAFLMANRALLQETRKNRTFQGRLFSRVPFKPLLFFLYSYLVRLGVFDGRAGFDYAFGLSWYYWLIGVKFRENHSLQMSSERSAHE